MNHNNVRTDRVSSLILVRHALMDCMFQLDTDRHCIEQDKTLRYIHLDNNDQLDMVDLLQTVSKNITATPRNGTCNSATKFFDTDYTKTIG